MLTKTFGSAVYGVNATTITVEVNTSKGRKFYHVGLPDNAVKEARERIDAAIKNIGYRMPGKRITVNMAPADIRKEGSAYDLPIALGILGASDQLKTDRLEDFVMMGELSLDGGIQPVKGILPIVLKAKQEGFKGVIVPSGNAAEAAIVSGIEIYSAASLLEVIAFFNEEGSLPIVEYRIALGEEHNTIPEHDFSEVKGQENIKRAMEIAASGGHNLILIGPPGAGKTMLAKRFPGILPPLTIDEALETTKIHSVAGKTGGQSSLITIRPFRSPHHTVSDVALVGGGGSPQPGEISLAHNGVLFLDELPEFKRTVLEVMRQPLEDRVVTISRAKFTVEYPASFMLVASMNPCPCGFYNHPEKECHCAPGVVQKYLNRISGPLLDRIDLHVEVTPVSFNELSSAKRSETSIEVRERVIRARQLQADRYKDDAGIYCNAQMSSRHLQQLCKIDEAGNALLKHAMNKLGLSARAYDRILKVSRTIADLAGSSSIKAEHLAEAIQYRSLDRDGWAG